MNNPSLNQTCTKHTAFIHPVLSKLQSLTLVLNRNDFIFLLVAKITVDKNYDNFTKAATTLSKKTKIS